MKSEFCETGPEHSSIKKHLLSMIDVKIFETFEDIHKSRYSKMEDLHDLLLKRKTIGGLQHSFKHKFFKSTLAPTQPSWSRNSSSSTSSRPRTSTRSRSSS